MSQNKVKCFFIKEKPIPKSSTKQYCAILQKGKDQENRNKKHKQTIPTSRKEQIKEQLKSEKYKRMCTKAFL